MKRSEMMAWTGLVGLLVIGIVLLTGGVMYNTTAFWAGTLLAFSQALVCGLAGWGLSLARQRAELIDLPATSGNEGFRMSLGDERSVGGTATSLRNEPEDIKTLDTSFQRMLVGITAVVLVGAAIWIIVMISSTFAWAKKNPDKPFPIAGSFEKLEKQASAGALDELGLMIGLSAAAGYFVLHWITRPRRREAVTGDAVASNFTLGLPGMILMGLATAIGYWPPKPYAAELAGGVIAALLLLQGLEIFVNAFRSYSAVEELDQEAVDLHALPLVPMLSSVWLGGLKMLFAQSVGLSRSTESGVIARMMPRALAAMVVIAILISCVRVVKPGEVAVLERLGHARVETGPNGEKRLAERAVLHPGLHITLPWPIDTLVTIPTGELQTTNIGAELHAPDVGGEDLDFQFWTVRMTNVSEGEDDEDQIITGDPAPQMLETFVVVVWRVADPARFYTGLSHSEFVYGSEGNKQVVPIYEALVKQATGFAVTRTFAVHKLDDIMTTGRAMVEGRCKQTLQQKLDEARSGIEIVDLTIKDLHPPFGMGLQPDPTNPEDPWRRGPAHAYENVVASREKKETRKNEAEAYKIAQVNRAKGEYASRVNAAKSYKSEVVARAEGEAARLESTLEGIGSLGADEQAFMMTLSGQQAMYRTLKDAFAPVSKIVVDPKVKDITLYQTTERGMQQIQRAPLPAP